MSTACTIFPKLARPAKAEVPAIAWRFCIPWSRACSVFLAVALTLLAGSGSLRANGWEHGAIPFEALTTALTVGDSETRRRAAQSLGFRGQEEAIAPLLKSLEKPEDQPQVRSAIYTALGQLRGQQALPALRGCLDSETRAELRADCIAALGRIADQSTFPRLVTALREDPSILVRSRVVDALSAFNSPQALAVLSDLVTTPANAVLAQRAIPALGRMTLPAAVTPLLSALANARSDRQKLVVVDALALLGSAAAITPLTKLLKQTDTAKLRQHITFALGASRDGNAYPALIDLLADPVPAVRYFAVEGLHKLGKPEAVEPLATLSLAISARLAKLQFADMQGDTLNTIADISLQVAILRALTDLDAARGSQALMAAAAPRELPKDSALGLRLAEAFYRQRRVALYGLAYTGIREAADLLTGDAGLGSPDNRLRAVAVRSLAVLGFADAAKTLLPLLSDNSAEIRWTAAAMLGLLKAKDAVAPLRGLLTDGNGEVRKQAVLSLAYLDAVEAGTAIARLAQEDASEKVRLAATYAVQLLKQ